MNTLILFGTIIVNLALVSYSIAIIGEQRKHRISATIFTFLTLGVVFDMVATAFMISGSSHSAISAHGLLGYSALLGMFIDWVMMFRFKRANGSEALVPRGLHLYSRYAYIWWVMAYITGAVLVALRH
jgi:hypothetical protein